MSSSLNQNSLNTIVALLLNVTLKKATMIMERFKLGIYNKEIPLLKKLKLFFIGMMHVVEE